MSDPREIMESFYNELPEDERLYSANIEFILDRFVTSHKDEISEDFWMAVASALYARIVSHEDIEEVDVNSAGGRLILEFAASILLLALESISDSLGVESYGKIQGVPKWWPLLPE